MFSKFRPWLIYWLYGLVLVHFATGVLMAWFINLPYFASYHQLILSKFWLGDAPASALALELWWINLFGATLQNLAIFMGVLIYAANRFRSRKIWGWLIIGFLVWAPQDILISAQRAVTMHLWIDGVALLALLPPLVILWRYDRAPR